MPNPDLASETCKESTTDVRTPIRTQGSVRIQPTSASRLRVVLALVERTADQEEDADGQSDQTVRRIEPVDGDVSDVLLIGVVASDAVGSGQDSDQAGFRWIMRRVRRHPMLSAVLDWLRDRALCASCIRGHLERLGAD